MQRFNCRLAFVQETPLHFFLIVNPVKEATFFKEKTISEEFEGKLEKSNLMKHFMRTHSKYALTRLKDEIFESTNSKLKDQRRDTWLMSH